MGSCVRLKEKDEQSLGHKLKKLLADEGVITQNTTAEIKIAVSSGGIRGIFKNEQIKHN